MRLIVVPVVLMLALLPAVHAQRVQAQTGVDGAVLQVVVLNPSTGGFYRRGTAFHVGGGMFLTSAHVVKSPKIPEGFNAWYLAGTRATLSPDTWIPVAIDCIHPLWRPPADGSGAEPYDVARLRVNGSQASPPSLAISPRVAQIGARVRIAGFPAASRAWPPVLYTATGRISAISISDHKMEIDVEMGFVLEGSSGSPVLGDDNSVLGIVYGGESMGPRTAGLRHVAVMTLALRQMCP